MIVKPYLSDRILISDDDKQINIWVSITNWGDDKVIEINNAGTGNLKNQIDKDGNKITLYKKK